MIPLNNYCWAQESCDQRRHPKIHWSTAQCYSEVTHLLLTIKLTEALGQSTKQFLIFTDGNSSTDSSIKKMKISLILAICETGEWSCDSQEIPGQSCLFWHGGDQVTWMRFHSQYSFFSIKLWMGYRGREHVLVRIHLNQPQCVYDTASGWGGFCILPILGRDAWLVSQREGVSKLLVHTETIFTWNFCHQTNVLQKCDTTLFPSPAGVL